MASFFQEVPIVIDGIHTQRGFILFGGDDGVTPSLRDDLWLYDFANSPTATCPWHKLADHAEGAPPTSDAAFGFDPATGLFLLAGGRVQEDGTLYASSQILTLDLNTLSAGFASVGTLPELDYTFTSTGSPSCATHDIDIWTTEIDPDCACEVCVQVATCSRNPCTGDVAAPPTGTDPAGYCQDLPDDPISACSGDPQCTDGVESLPVDIAAPGLWGSQFFMNPETGALWLIGGSTGCEGTGCGEWQAVFDADTVGGQNIAAANSPLALRVDGDGVVSTYDLDLSGMTPVDWPDQSSTGIRSGAAAWMGAPWSLAERDTVGTAADPIPHTVGGTGFQSVAPSRNYVLATHSQSFDDACPDFVVEVVDSGGFQPGDIVWEDVDEGTLGPSEALLRFDPDTQDWTFDGSTPDYDGAYYVSAAAMDPSHLLAIVGGKFEDDGTSRIQVFDNADGALHEVDGDDVLGARYAAGVVGDPVTGTVYVFGGTVDYDNSDGVPADNGVYQLTGPESVFPDSAGRFEMGAMTPTYSYVSTDHWLVGNTIPVTVDCGGAACVLNQIDVVLPSTDAATGSALLWIDYGDGLGETAATQVSTVGIGTETEQVWRLPRYATEGDVFTVRVQWEPTVTDPVTLEDVFVSNDLMLYSVACATGDPCTVLAGLPAWIGDPLSDVTGLGACATMSVATSGNCQDVSIASTTITPPAGSLAFAPGELLGSGAVATMGPFEHAWPRGFRVLVLPGGAQQAGWMSDGGAPVDFAFDADASGTTTDPTSAVSYAASGLGQADMVVLESRFSPLERAWHMVFLTDSAASWADVSGVTGLGFSLISAGAGAPPAPYESTAAHELAHAWVGVGGRVDDGWLREGLPQLFMWARHPGLADPLFAAMLLSEGEAELGLPNDLRLNSPPSRLMPLEYQQYLTNRNYSLGALALSQFHFLGMASELDSEASWARWADLFGEVVVAESIDPVAVNGWLVTQAWGDEFVDDWLATATRGAPLLGWTELSRDPSSTGDSADTAGGVGAVTLTLSQIQHTMYNGTSFGAVPYFLTCSPASDTSALGDEDCQGTRDALNGDSPQVLQELANITFEGFGESPIEVSIANLAVLLPDNEAIWGDHENWITLCRESDVDILCVGDSDGDGWANSTDCHTAEATIHPVNPGEPAGVDADCDGWTWPL